MGPSRIVTVTLNPAIDKIVEAARFAVGKHLPARRIGRHPAGKGINVAKFLAMLGSRCVATGLIGRDELTLFEEYLERVGERRITTQLLVVRGQTRENITIVDPVMDTETHVREQGFQVQRDDVRRITSKIGMLAREDTTIILAGSIPKGVTPGDFRTILHRCQDHGARIVVDAGAGLIEALRGEPVWMVKLNSEELAAMSGMSTASEQETIDAATAVSTVGGGSSRYVIATRGAEGACLIGPDISVIARVFVHPGLISNTVGCGDALLAGTIHEWNSSHDWRAALRFGVATATAKAVSRTPGSFEVGEIQGFYETAMMEEIQAAGAG